MKELRERVKEYRNTLETAKYVAGGDLPSPILVGAVEAFDLVLVLIDDPESTPKFNWPRVM